MEQDPYQEGEKMTEGDDPDDPETRAMAIDIPLGTGQDNTNSTTIVDSVKQIRDEKGRFVETNGNGRYNRKYQKGKNCQYSRYVWERVNGLIPKGKMIHHKNGDKKDDRLENLQLMTYKKHNKLHGTGRTPWNKDKKCPKISKSKMGHKVTQEQIKKQKKTWKNKYIVSMKNIDYFKKEGFAYKDIGEMIGITENCAIHRHRKYLKDYCGEESGLL